MTNEKLEEVLLHDYHTLMTKKRLGTISDEEEVELGEVDSKLINLAEKRAQEYKSPYSGILSRKDEYLKLLQILNKRLELILSQYKN